MGTGKGLSKFSRVSIKSIIGVYLVLLAISTCKNKFGSEYDSARAKEPISISQTTHPARRVASSLMNIALKTGELPYQLMGYTLLCDYREIRKKALFIAGVDDRFEPDNEKRFALYHELGFAVLDTAMGNKKIYIPTAVWIQYIKEKTGKEIQAKKIFHESIYERQLTEFGRNLFTIDSVFDNGSKGFVTSQEMWGALRELGYLDSAGIVLKTESYLDFLTGPARSEELARIMNKGYGSQVKSTQIMTPSRWKHIDKIARKYVESRSTSNMP